MITLKDIISDANSWNDLYGKLCKQENRSGKLFEEFCKYYYLSEPSVCFEYKHIWFFDDVPRKNKRKS